MGFSEAIKNVFKHYACFKGRARRSEYLSFILFNFIVSFVLSGIGRIIANLLPITDEYHLSIAEGSMLYIWNLAIFIPLLALSVRRLHDIGKSGWSYLISFIPLVGWIIYLVWVFKDSESGANKYGDSPKYPTNDDSYGNQYQPQGNYYNPQQQNNYYSPVQPNQPPVQQYLPYQQPVQSVQPTAAPMEQPFPTEPQIQAQNPAVLSREDSNTGYDSPYDNQE